MTDEELRLECYRLALLNKNTRFPVVEYALILFNFAKGNSDDALNVSIQDLRTEFAKDK